MTKHILTLIIAKLHEIGYTVVAITSDLGQRIKRYSMNWALIVRKVKRTFYIHAMEK